MKEYLTPAGEGQSEFIEKRSRFLSFVSPAETEDDALAYLNKIKTAHKEATIVYTYSCRDRNITRFSDGGEPHGTAGMPALEVFKKSGVTDFVCVIVRYFGGVHLGAGGLVRAFSKAASDGIVASGIVKVCPSALFEVRLAYHQLAAVSATLSDGGASTDDIEYAEDIRITGHIEPSGFDNMASLVRDATAGSVEVLLLGEGIVKIRI